MMRLTDLATGRAGLPRRFSEGFNPHPKLMLPLPRPVAVAAEGERAIIELTDPVDPVDAAARLDRQFPSGVTVTGCELLPAEPSPRARSARFVLDADPAAAEAMARRRGQLADRPRWECVRHGRKRGVADRTLDLKRLLDRLDVDGRTLTFVLVPDGQVWARPDEVLGLMGLDPRADVAALCRRHVEWSDDRTAPKSPHPSA